MARDDEPAEDRLTNLIRDRLVEATAGDAHDFERVIQNILCHIPDLKINTAYPFSDSSYTVLHYTKLFFHPYRASPVVDTKFPKDGNH